MQPHEFQTILNALPLLTNQQRNELIESLAEKDSPIGIAETIEANFTKAPKCPHCGSEDLHKWGVRNKRQRYRCKACRSTLNSFSKTHLARLQKPEKWDQYLEGVTNSMTLRPAAKRCGVNLKTAFRWRHRFLKAVECDQALELSGITELDETLFRESFKGQKKGLPRPARKRGSDKKSECRKIPVMVARDRSGSTVDGVLENGSADEICKHLNARINIETVVCADASLAHEKLARKLGFIFKELVTSSGQKVLDGVFHLQHVNAYHSHLKQWIKGVFHGVATKYLPHYLGWRRALTESIPLDIDRLTNKIICLCRLQPENGT